MITLRSHWLFQDVTRVIESKWFFYVFSLAFILILGNTCGEFATFLTISSSTLAIGTIVIVIIFLRPEIGLSLFIASIFFEECWLVGGITIAKAIGLVTLGAWLVRFPFSANRRLILPQQAWLTVLLLAFGLLSIFWATDEQVIVRRVIMGAGLLGTFVVIVNIVDSPAKLQRVSSVIAIAGLVAGLLALNIYFFGELFESELQRARIVPGQNPNVFAASLIPAFALFSIMVMRQQEPIQRMTWSLGHLVVTVSVLLSMSRGVMIALAAVLVLALVLARYPRQRILLFLLTLGEVAIVIFLNPEFLGRVESLVTVEARGAGRLDIWLTALTMISTHPVRGVGLSNFPIVFFDYFRRTPGVQRHFTEMKTPHNIYLGMLAELGIIGFVILAGILGASVVSAMRARHDAYQKTKGRYLQFASDIWLLGLVGLLVEGFLQDIFFRKFFWLGLGLVEVMKQLSSQEERF